MKTVKCLFLCFFALIFCNDSIRAQCPQGDVILTTQAEVDDFAATYPSCTYINGRLSIGDSDFDSDITDLSNLPPIESISSSLYIIKNPTLTDLIGLENVTSIGDYLLISDNDTLADLSDLENVTSIGGLIIREVCGLVVILH